MDMKKTFCAKNLEKVRSAACRILFFAVVGGAAFACSKAYGKPTQESIRDLLTSLLGTGIVWYLWMDAAICQKLPSVNIGHKYRFFLFYLLLYAVSLVLPMINCMAWPFMCFFVMLMLFSNPLIGLCSGSVLLEMALLLCDESAFQPFFLYFIAGMAAIALFQHASENLLYGLPIALSLMLLFVLLTGYYVLFLNQTFALSMFIVPVVNVLFSGLILLILLNAFALYVVRGGSDMYMEINDPEFPLLVSMKEKDRRVYYTAIHTAYLAERVAADLDMDSRGMKSCSYYHNVGILEDRAGDPETAVKYFDKYHFPKEAIALLTEYITCGKSRPVSKQATIVGLCEDLVMQLMDIFEKDKTAKPDIDRMIEGMFRQREIDGIFLSSETTFAEIAKVKKLLKKEKLYYDFLR